MKFEGVGVLEIATARGTDRVVGIATVRGNDQAVPSRSFSSQILT